MGNQAFTWGDTATVIRKTNLQVRPGVYGSICGVTEVTNRSLAEKYGVPIGSYLYTVEYSDGSDYIVPEELLLLQKGAK